ncbi:MAG: hypothetical protein K8R64_02965 [Methanosarcinaceae archaeon]|nr:hypothetical protein [Methanosarcinaceae archaeon]
MELDTVVVVVAGNMVDNSNKVLASGIVVAGTQAVDMVFVLAVVNLVVAPAVVAAGTVELARLVALYLVDPVKQAVAFVACAGVVMKVHSIRVAYLRTSG